MNSLFIRIFFCTFATDMKRVWFLFSVLLVLAIGGLYHEDIPTSEGVSFCWQEQLSSKTESQQKALWLDASKQEERQQAVFSSTRQSSRIANTRPQRLLPSQCTRHDRPSGKLPTGDLKPQHYSHLKSFYGQGPIRLSVPRRLCLSRDYYIIALRRILC